MRFGAQRDGPLLAPPRRVQQGLSEAEIGQKSMTGRTLLLCRLCETEPRLIKAHVVPLHALRC